MLFMKKLLFILILICSSQGLAIEESDIDYSKYIEAIHSDFKWTSNIMIMFEIFMFEIGNCNDIIRSTVILKNLEPTEEDEKIMVNAIRKIYHPNLPKKYINEYKFMGWCNINNQTYRLHKKANWPNDLWSVVGYVNSHAINKNEIFEYIDFPYNHEITTPKLTERKQQKHSFLSYKERENRIRERCEKIEEIITKDEAIKACKYQLGLK